MSLSRSRILPATFFRRPALAVAPDLLGKFLVRQRPTNQQALMITEVEAYDGPADLASHAARGRRTARTETMFQPGGVWYVYLVYGRYWMLNIVTGPADYPAAILFRGVRGIVGPGKLTEQFQIDKTYNQLPATSATGLFVIDRGIKVPSSQIKTAPRVGVDYAGPLWSRKPYRFLLQ